MVVYATPKINNSNLFEAIKMAIGKIIRIDDKTKKVIGEVSGCFMMKGYQADLTEVYKNTIPPNLTDIGGISLENFIPHIIKGPLGGEVIQMYGLRIDSLKKGVDDQLYGHVDLGHYSMAILFLRAPGEMVRLESGGTEWPLWQENELRGHKIPLIDGSGKVLLEDICFGKAQLITKEMWGRFEYVRSENIYTENAAQDVVGINREDFRRLIQPIQTRLKEYKNAAKFQAVSSK